MSVKGWDHSFSPPNPTCMWNNGYRFVLGYVGPGSGKQLTQAQVDLYHGIGLNIGFLVEGAAGDIFAGSAVGREHAQEAVAGARALGAPVNGLCVFTFAADEDITASNIDQATLYFQGVAEVLSANSIGVYGDTDIINRLHNDGLATFFFLTAARAWDGLPPEPYIDVDQVQNGINMCDGNFDLDTAPNMPRGLWVPNQTTGDDEMLALVVIDAGLHPTNNGIYLSNGMYRWPTDYTTANLLGVVPYYMIVNPGTTPPARYTPCLVPPGETADQTLDYRFGPLRPDAAAGVTFPTYTATPVVS